MKTRIFIAAVMALAAMACSRNGQNQELTGRERITFAAADESGLFSVTTKADEVTALSAFYVSAVTSSAGVEASAWNSTEFSLVPASDPATYAANKFWPSSNPSYLFYASNLPLLFDAGETTVSASNATDVVCAYMTEPAYEQRNTLAFEHIFARIGDVIVTAEEGYTISNLTITVTPKVSGTYNLRTGAGQSDGTGWSSPENGSETTICSRTEGIAPSASYTHSNDVWLIPGSYTLTAGWTATKDDYTQSFTGKTATVDIVGGKVNSISASIVGNATQINLGVSLTAWGTNDINVGTISL
jgi:hypothetical protein